MKATQAADWSAESPALAAGLRAALGPVGSLASALGDATGGVAGALGGAGRYAGNAAAGLGGLLGDVTGLRPALPADVVGRASQALSQRAQSDASENLKRVGLAGLGLGAAGAGAAGLYNLLRRNLRSHKPDPRLVSLPYPATPEEEEAERGLPLKALKAATAACAAAAPTAADRVKRLKKAPPMPAGGPVKAGPVKAAAGEGGGLFGIPGFLGGSSAVTAGDIPAYRPAMAAAAVGGLGGGYLLTQMLLDRRRKKEQDDALNRDRGAFQDQLLASYGAKKAALDGAFDDLLALGADATTKRASVPGFMGARLGDYLTYAALASGLSGLAGWQLAQKRSPSLALDRAVKERARARLSGRPDPLYALPTPVVPAEEEEKTVPA